MLLVAIAIATFLNIALIKYKVDKRSYIDAIVDAMLLVGVFMVFKGSFNALVVGTISSLLVSIYLIYSPIKIGGILERS